MTANSSSNDNMNIGTNKVLALPQLGSVLVRYDIKLAMQSRQPTSFGTRQSSRSMIDNTLAQACSLKRARSGSDVSKESVIRRASGSRAKFVYKNRNPGGVGPMRRSSYLKIAGFGSGSSMLADVRTEEEMCPQTFITKVLLDVAEQNDGRLSKAMQPLRASEFLPVTDEQIVAYSNDAIAAVRNNDLEALRKIRDEGRTLRCRNRFGESLLHTACRASSPAVVAFLLREADVDPRVRDDYGRTPLHDACWRGRPSYEVVEALLRAEPRLALAKDVRGHVPFAYARREHWGGWREFLERRRDLFLQPGDERASS